MLNTMILLAVAIFSGSGESSSAKSNISNSFILHKNISVTTFWIGEEGVEVDGENRIITDETSKDVTALLEEEIDAFIQKTRFQNMVMV